MSSITPESSTTRTSSTTLPEVLIDKTSKKRNFSTAAIAPRFLDEDPEELQVTTEGGKINFSNIYKNSSQMQIPIILYICSLSMMLQMI